MDTHRQGKTRNSRIQEGTHWRNHREFNSSGVHPQGYASRELHIHMRHELMHIWFYSRGITDASPALIEGSCNLTSFLILKNRKEPEAAYLIQNLFADPHKVYGKGFRKMHKILKNKGLQGWLNYISRKQEVARKSFCFLHAGRGVLRD